MVARLKVSVGQYSSRGVKADNQDAVGFYIPANLALLETKGIACAIADGLSSSNEGKQASQACVTGFMSDYFSTPDSWSVKQSGSKVLTAINTWLHGQSHQFQQAGRGMASTFSAVVVKSTTAHIFHVGDSRIYLLRDGELEPITTDHRIRIDVNKEYLGRAFGVDYCLDIDYKSFAVQENDVFLLTTDGVHDVLPDKVLKQFLLAGAGAEPEQYAQQICDEALSAGSKDNISCQILTIEQLPTQDPDEVFAQLTALPFPPDLYEGVIIDGYRISRELHASSTSQLYLAVDTESGDKVVIKTPSVNFEDDPAYLERFLLEEWVGRRINNAHVVRTIEQKRPRRFLYYIMEYVDGKTLEQWLNDVGRLDLKTVREIVPQLVSAIRAFHRLDMLHQDLKPGNIMISRDGVVKLIDFGSTKIAGIADISTPVERSELLGTKHYTAPEYLLGRAGQAASDQFSLACIVYEMLTGQLPYAEKLAKVRARQDLHRIEYQSINTLIHDIPSWVDKTLQKALQLYPERRYQALSEFATDLIKPNPAYLRDEKLPLMYRYPVKFWQICSLILLLLNCLCLYFLLK
ncbi:MAG TPA: bifunctional protein-serine/threonine kinase/phosphatase [Methylophaga aminisulfidivorans]|uniref:bifunctional protein-serine/threonine kinase/phosphatase n=1 Tax=Methylophaga TaxID=40222 RepID=UPI00176AC045|nr:MULTISPECIES: bifunctional protein-serine/threonine kinase/phosphatase [Methylophaga]HIC45633.1 bifunctional protein-serine/threonine kinase/phosphatase [Methylophaga sp.]HIM39986.1 bifunctional protein-serine/threonine kinase/phosphatase [Methylophaga aminisulfidivorans]